MDEMNKKAPEAEKKASKPAKPKKDKKPLGQRIAHFFRSYKSEIGKIVWCPWKQVYKNSLVVLAVVIACAVAICALDQGFSRLFFALSDIQL